MTQYPLPISCNVTVETLITEHPVVIPVLERFGISTTERTARGLDGASRAACVATAKLCDTLAATIEVDRIAACWWPGAAQSPRMQPCGHGARLKDRW